MSSLDRWLAPFTHADKIANLATSATLIEKRQKSGISLVAISCGMPATAQSAENKALKSDVAKVAEVADFTWNTSDWQGYYDERAGIAEYTGGVSRVKAECIAFESCISHWLNKNPPIHRDANICPQCANPIDTRGTGAIATLIGNNSYLWLHDKCHTNWRNHRRQQAVKALLSIGIAGKYP